MDLGKEKNGRSVITTHIQKLYFLSQHKKTSILSCLTNEQIVFYTTSLMTFVFLNAKLVVLCFIIRHEFIFVLYFNSGLRFSFCFLRRVVSHHLIFCYLVILYMIRAVTLYLFQFNNTLRRTIHFFTSLD